MRLVMVGPNGSGKGTQAKLLKDELGIAHISTGDLLRSAVSAGTEVGLHAKAVMEAGQLMPDDVVVKLLAERLEDDDAAGGFILDGFPRNLAQAATLDEMLDDTGRPLDVAIGLNVPDAAILERCEFRFVTERRPDDDPDVVRERLAIYHRHTAPLIGLYADRGILAAVDGVGEVGEVFTRCLRALPR